MEIIIKAKKFRDGYNSNLPLWFMEKYNLRWGASLNNYRNNKELIQWLNYFQNKWKYLKVINIPDNVSDWMIEEKEGREQIIAVIDGRIIIYD